MANPLERITVSPTVCHGQPCIKGTRIMVWLILQYLANGDTIEDILTAYPDLDREDVKACLAYAAEMAREREVPIFVKSRTVRARKRTVRTSQTPKTGKYNVAALKPSKTLKDTIK